MDIPFESALVHASAVHVCSCGRSYDEESWAQLPLAGFQQAENPDLLLELRGCPCKSHRAVEIPGPGFWLDLAIRRLTEARQESHAELPALALSYMERAFTCVRQAEQLQKILLNQRDRRAAEAPALQAAE